MKHVGIWIIGLYLLFMPVVSVVGDETGLSDVTVLDEIVVTATKTEEKRKDIPNSVIVIDENDIKKSPAKSVGELLANELGIDWRTYGDYGGAGETIQVRGMSSNGTQVLVNGIEYNSPSLGTADVGGIPLNSIERIEIVKGSGSLLYGSGAMGGTINIITKRPKKDKIDCNATAGYGTQNTSQLSVDHGMFLTDNIGYYISANRKESDGFRDNSDLTHKDVSLNLVLDKGKDLDISIYADYMDREYEMPRMEPPAGTQDYFFNGVQFYNDESANLVDHGTDEDYHFGLRLKSSPLDWLDYTVETNYADMENYQYSRSVSNWGPPWYIISSSGSRTWVNNKVKTIEGNINVHPNDSAGILMGVDYKTYDWKYDNITLDETGADTLRDVYSDDLHTTGAFTEAQYRFNHYLKLIAGFRQEDHSEFGKANLPLYGIVVNPASGTTVKLSHGKHFNAPTPNDLFWPDGPYACGNPDLLPEKGWHTDLIIEQELLDNRLFLTLSYFNWDVDNKIKWDAGADGKWFPQNQQSYEADGFELGLMAKPNQKITFLLSFTYTDAVETEKDFTKQDYNLWPPDLDYTWVDRQAAYTPRRQFKSVLTYLTDFDLSFSATFRYVGERNWYRTEYSVEPYTETVKYILDDYCTTDIKLEQRLYNHWVIALNANNIFDKSYDTYLSVFEDVPNDTDYVTGYPGAGRSLFFNVSYEY